MPDKSYVQPERVAAAITNLGEWRNRARSQAAMHLWPLLAIMKAGANKASTIVFTDTDEFPFWDEFFRLPGEDRERKDAEGKPVRDYYVDPLTKQFRAGDYPHHSPSTFRIKTFSRSWNAAEFSDVDKTWKLSADYVIGYLGGKWADTRTPQPVP